MSDHKSDRREADRKPQLLLLELSPGVARPTVRWRENRVTICYDAKHTAQDLVSAIYGVLQVGQRPLVIDRFGSSMAVDVLHRRAKISSVDAEVFVAAMKKSARAPSGYIGMTVLMDELETCERLPPPAALVKEAMSILLQEGLLRGQWTPYHQQCDTRVGSDEASAEVVALKASESEYGRNCPNCHEYIDSVDAIVTRVSYFLPPEFA